MSKRPYILAGFLFVNFIWQTIVWSRASLSPPIGWPLAILLPLVAGFVLFRFVYRSSSNGWASIFFIGGGLVVAIYLAATFTRLYEFAEHEVKPGFVFAGSASDASSARESEFYWIREFRHETLDKARFGFSYSLHLSKGSTRYIEHFVLPVFDASDTDRPSLWVYKSVPTIYVIKSVDEYIDFAKDGLDLEAFRSEIRGDSIFGRIVDDGDSERAVGQYLSRFPVSGLGKPLLIELINETPEHYFQIAAVHFWLTTIVLNLIFGSVCFVLGLLLRMPKPSLL